MKQYTKKDIREFLIESNAIEGKYDKIFLDNSLKAWEYAFKNKNKIDISYILKIHFLLAIENDKSIAGKFRDCDVWFCGSRKKNHGPHGFEIMVNGWINSCDINKIKKLDNKESIILNWHLDFQDIYPFRDYNGSVGRILLNIHRFLVGLPILIIHEGEEQVNYYNLFTSRNIA